jgi:hypothetical protein
MKSKVAISIGLSLMIAAAGGEIGSDRQSMMPLAVAASKRVSNGMVVFIRGDVQVIRFNGRLIRPTTGTRIYPGDRLQTTQTGQVLVQCTDLTTQSVSASQNQLNRCPEVSEQSNCPGIIECPHRGNEIAWNNAQIPYIISPRRTKLLNNKPTLRWNPVPGANSYTVSVEGEDANWTTRVNDTQVIYGGEPLKPGGYYLLIVETNTGASSLDEPVRPRGLHFSLLDEDRAKHVRAEAQQIAQHKWTDQTKALALANLYIKNGLISEAVEKLEVLAEGGLETAPIYRTLGDLYLNYLALVPQASAYYLKSIELADPQDVEMRTAVLDELGQLQAAMGKKDEAVHWLTQAQGGCRALQDLECTSALEKQLRDLVSEGGR